MRTPVPLLAASMALGAMYASPTARASGSVERILEVLTHPSDPAVIIARYGRPDVAEGSGLMFSRDRGATFQVACADFVADGIALGSSETSYKSQVHMDASGNLLVTGSSDEVYVGDSAGCTFAKQPGFANTRGLMFASDPSDPAATYLLTARRDEAMPNARASGHVMRRDARGAWSTVADVKKDMNADAHVYPSSFLVAKLASGATRMLVHYNLYVEGSLTDQFKIGLSDDGGATFSEHPLALSDAQNWFRLLAFDPQDPDRVLALEYRKARRDRLLLSRDGGMTFALWAEVDQFAGAAFGESGKVYVAATVDVLPASRGGLYTAAKLGDPLVRVPDSPDLDCVHYRASDKTLFGCRYDEVGTLETNSGAFRSLARMENATSLLDCPEKNARSLCEAQLNAGSSWCCVGHFPWTSFCALYEAAPKSGPVCGAKAREYDCKNSGRCSRDAPVQANDGGLTTEGSADAATDSADEQASGGCQCASSPKASSRTFLTLGIVCAALSLRRRRRGSQPTRFTRACTRAISRSWPGR